METKGNIEEVIRAINTNKKYPALKLVQGNLETAAVISKLIHNGVTQDFDIDSEWASNNVNTASIKYLSHTILDTKRSASNMMELFPDMEIAVQILVSSILSPKDMTGTDLIYTVNNSFLNSEVTGAFINVIKNAMEFHYKIIEDMPKMLRQTLFDAGSYSILVIPENALDELINRSQYITQESLENKLTQKGKLMPLGILGNPSPKEIVPKPGNLSLEAFGDYTRLPYEEYQYGVGTPSTEALPSDQSNLIDFITVTDNFNILKLPSMINANNSHRLKAKLAQEDARFPGYNVDIPVSKKLEQLVYKQVSNNTTPFVSIKTKDTAKRNPVGRPLVLNLPAEAVVPVYTPGDETDHVGYFIMIDSEGHPLNKNSLEMTNIDNMNGTTFMNANMNSPDLSNFITNKAAYNLNGSPTSGMSSKELTSVFANIIENDLINRLQNGIYKTKLEIGRVSEIYRIMLQRALASQQTQLVFVPAELMSYFAYKYHPNGVGKSLIEDVRILNSLRAMTMFARIMASVRNSIGVTEVKMKFDERDPDPQKTIEMMMHEVMKTRQQFFPLGINSPSDLAEWVQRSGFEFTFEGHPKIPDMNLDFEQKANTNVKPDEDLDAELKRRSILAFGLSPETVDSGFAAEFATTVVSNNILLSKRVMQIQQVFMPLVSKYVRQLVKNDMVIYNELLGVLEANQDILSKNYTDEEKELMKTNKFEFYAIMIDKLMDLFEVSLPSPNTTTLDTQMVALKQYTEALDEGLNAWISTEAITSNLVGDVANDIDALKAVIKSYYIRKWMTENNVLPELNDLTLADEEGNPKINLFDIQKDHLDGLLKTAAKFIKGLDKMKDKFNKELGVQGDTVQDELGEPDNTDVSSDIEEAGAAGVDDLNLGDAASEGTPAEEPVDDAEVVANGGSTDTEGKKPDKIDEEADDDI